MPKKAKALPRSRATRLSAIKVQPRPHSRDIRSAALAQSQPWHPPPGCCSSSLEPPAVARAMVLRSLRRSSRLRNTNRKAYAIDLPRGMNKKGLADFYSGIEVIKNGVAYDKRYSANGSPEVHFLFSTHHDTISEILGLDMSL